jgi:hypothetical protein
MVRTPVRYSTYIHLTTIPDVVLDIEGYHSHGRERSNRPTKFEHDEAKYSSSVENTPGPSSKSTGTVVVSLMYKFC